MICSVAKEMLGAYLDGELDANAEMEIRMHVESCADCSRTLERLRARQVTMRQGALHYSAPSSLEARIRNSLRSEQRRRKASWQAWIALAATLLLVSAISLRFLPRRVATESDIADQAVAGHIRALLTGHTADVASTDQHTIKPWFNGRLDFSPPVSDLATDGFPLIGGRLDYIQGRPAATLVYQRRKHLIDLFIWPSGKDGEHSEQSRKGYNTLLWSDRGMSYAAVSDLNFLELEQFKSLLLK